MNATLDTIGVAVELLRSDLARLADDLAAHPGGVPTTDPNEQAKLDAIAGAVDAMATTVHSIADPGPAAPPVAAVPPVTVTELAPAPPL